MSGAPKPFTNAFNNLPSGSFRYNTSQAGTAIAIVYGTQRTSVNLLEFWGYTGAPGGKGKGGTTSSSGGKKGSGSFAVNVAFGICQGPLPSAFTGARAGNNNVYSNGGVTGFSQTGLTGFAGDDGQAPDAAFVTGDPNTPVVGYSGICYVVGAPMQLGSSPVLPNIGFEIFGFLAGTVGPSYPNDANPALIIEDILTNSRYGAGFPSANLDVSGSLADFATYCQAAQLAMSLLMDRPQAASHWVDEITQLSVAAPFWSGSLFKIVPYSTGAVSANGASWSPNLTPIYAVDDDDFIPWEGQSGGGQGGTDPVTIERNDWASLTNWLSLEYYDSNNSYNPNIQMAFDQGAIDANGVRSKPSIAAHEFTNSGSAAISAQLQLDREQAVRNTFKFQLGWRFALLEPMDVVEISDASLGISSLPVRITSKTETDNGELQFEAEDLPNAASSSPPVYDTQDTAGAPLPLYATPPDTNLPVIFDAPPELTNGANEVVVVASGGTDWGGCNVWVSLDGSTYKQVGTIFAGAPQGVLSAGITNYTGANPDTGNTLSVDLTESLGTLVSASASDAANLVSLCIVGNELIAYQTATLTAANKYDLTTLYRGSFGTPITAHIAGEQFAFLGAMPNSTNKLTLTYPSNLVGQTLHVKLPAFNSFGLEVQDLSGVSATSYTLTGGGSSPLDNPVLTTLAAGVNEDWGIVGTTVIASADLRSIVLATGLDINLGTLP